MIELWFGSRELAVVNSGRVIVVVVKVLVVEQ